jgi:probable F420-dependent oxidoreductase
MRLGISLEPLGPAAGRESVLGAALRAERAGFDSVQMSSHLLANQFGSAIDPLVMLAAVAGATSSLELGTSVLILPYYDPVVLANQTASLDVLSGGRFTLGVGAGWNAEEFGAVGVQVAERGRRSDEYLAILKALWSGDAADYAGEFTRFENARLGVRPVTPGGPAIRVGGHSDAALRRALRFGDGWHGSGVAPGDLPGISARLATFGAEVGRDPAELELSTVAFLTPPGCTPLMPAPGHTLGGDLPSRDSVLEELGELEAAGMTLVNLWMPVVPAEASAAVDWVGAEILPALTRTSAAT